MAFESVNVGDKEAWQPGTSNQTGNHATKFAWKGVPWGKVATITAKLVAHHVGWSDNDMMYKNKKTRFPPVALFSPVFTRTLPWFRDEYNMWRAQHSNGHPQQPFEASDAHNRVVYMFTKPKGKKARVYGISTEHPDHTEQAKSGGLRETWLTCSTKIAERIRAGGAVTFTEAVEWGGGDTSQQASLFGGGE